jgi:glycosyltransferase involved in cell wall biosynthesis
METAHAFAKRFRSHLGMDEKLFNGSQPLVSILMCSYNGLPYIQTAVQCVLDQTYQNWELLIGDDGSTDGSKKWLSDNFSHHPKIKIFFHEKNMGYVANKNFIHQQAKGELITQLDNDDTCPADRVEKQVAVFIQNRTIKMVGCGYHLIDMEGHVYEVVSTSNDEIIYEKPDGKYPFWFPSLMIHKSVFNEIGYFDPYFAGALGDDIYWTYRANTRYPIFVLKEVLYGYRNNPNSITNQFNNLRKLIMPKVLEKLFGQLKETGTDWLSEKDFSSLANFENQLVNNKEYMSEQYRIWSAKACDKENLGLAWQLLWRAIKNSPFKFVNLQTLFYALRTQLTVWVSK